MKNRAFPLNISRRYRTTSIVLSLGLALFLVWAGANACPFCSVESQTLSEETQSADAVVLAKLLKEAPPASNVDDGFGVADPEAGMATFQVVEVLKGPERLSGAKEIKVVFFGESDRKQVYLVSGIGAEKIDWTTPLPLSAAGVEYARKLPEIPASGPDRLAFFQEHLEHEDPLLAQDAYDEFARAPYADVKALGPRMHHDRLIEWVNDPDVSPSRRRLYLTMLGVCGTAEDVPMLEALIASDFQKMKPHLERLVSVGLGMGGPLSLPIWVDLVDQDERRKKMGLDALIGAYLTLHGPDGMDLIDQRFLKNPHTEYTHTYSTIMALRVLGEELSGAVPRERLLQSMRLLLDNPEFADQVILDLARWEDWLVLDRLVTMFKESDENSYVRQPIVSYLTVASEQAGNVGSRATTALAELEQMDPEGVKQARSLMAFGALGRARASTDTASANRSGADATTAPDEGAAESEQQATVAADDAIQENANQATTADEFPDPADYARDDGKAQTASQQNVAKQPATVTEEVAAVSSNPQSASAIPADASKEAPLIDVAEAEVNPVLIVGVPLIAAIALMGIYWLILRTGAV